MTESWRVFCAIELPAEVRERVVDHIEQLRKAAPSARASWARYEALHITLKFFGEIESQRVAALSKSADRAARRTQSFALGLKNTGSFPPRSPARVLWLGVDDRSGALISLQQALEDECSAEEFVREERGFHPHLTIGRLRSPQGARALTVLHNEMTFPLLEFSVSELLVIRSELGPNGSRYTGLSRHALQSS